MQVNLLPLSEFRYFISAFCKAIIPYPAIFSDGFLLNSGVK